MPKTRFTALLLAGFKKRPVNASLKLVCEDKCNGSGIPNFCIYVNTDGFVYRYCKSNFSALL